MAQSINQRLALGGLDEVRRGIASVKQDVEQSGNSIRQALLSATQGTRTFSDGVMGTEVSAKATRYAIQNLSFQVNDVVTSLASGISPFRTFTQQSGQFVQLFQQGGGVGAVVGGFASRLAALVTPARLAVAGILAVGTAVAALAVRAENSAVSQQKFDLQLKAISNQTSITGKDLEDAAKRMGDVGLSADEARTKLRDFLSAGGDPRLANTIVRGAENLSAVLGKSTGDSFAQAVGEGSLQTLQNIAKRLNISINEATKATFIDFAELNRKLNFEIIDSVIKRDREIVELQRKTQQQIRDLTREPGTERSFPGQEDPTQRKEILVQSNREEINIRRQNQYQINDMLRLAARERNEENRRALAAYNKDIEDKANEAGEIRRLALAISQKVEGQQAAQLGPLGTAMQHLRIDWNNFLDALTNSKAVLITVDSLGKMLQTIQGVAKIIGILVEINLKALGDAFEYIKNTAADWFSTPIYWINYFIGLIEKAWNLLKTLPTIGSVAARGILTNTSGLPDTGLAVNAAPTIPGNKEGGMFRGPGTGTSDSILARVSDGEFLVNAAATRMNLPLLKEINSMSRPISAPRRGFAAGGLVGLQSVDSRTKFTFVIEGRPYADLTAPDATMNNLLQHARTSSMLRLGTIQGWK